MSKKQYPMTQAKLEELKAELRHKLEVEKPAIAARLKAAIEMGDLSENAEYASAKEDQAFLQGRIDELEQIIRGAVIIEGNDNHTGTIQLGSRVTLIEGDAEQPETYLIVGQVEADPRAGKISDESPLGVALLGRRIGDVVTVQAPAGELVFKIIGVD